MIELKTVSKSFRYKHRGIKPTDEIKKVRKYTFSKKEKLKSKKLFEKLFAEGKSISNYPIKLLFLKSELPKSVKFQAGVVVPKKKFKSAVKRNRIKRLLREAYRLNKHFVFNNSEGDFAFLFLYLGKELPTYLEVEKSIQILLKKFKKKADDAKDT